MAPRLRPAPDKAHLMPERGLRDYSKARPSYVKKQIPRKSNFGLFAQLFAVGAAFTLSFSYVSNDAFRQSVSNAVAAILPAPPAPRDAKEVQHSTASIDPFAAAQETIVVPQKPVVVTVKPPSPPPPLVQTKKVLPPPPAVKAVVPKPVDVVQTKISPIPLPPLPKPVTQVAAMKVAVPAIVPAAKITPVAAPPPAAVAMPSAPVFKPPAVLPPIVATVPAPLKIEKPLVAQVVPAPVVQIPTPAKPAKIQERLEDPPVPVEKTAERLLPQRVQGDVIVDCENCPALVVVVAAPDGDVNKVQNVNYSANGATMPPFAIGKNEITFDDWDRCVSDGGCTTKPSDEGWGRGLRPVIEVSFNDVNDQYIPWLSRISKQKYRLPSEAEWEFAVRGGTTANTQFAYSFGDDVALLCDYGNSSDLAANIADSKWSGTPCNDGFATTAPVGSLKPNALGIFDMHGNVWEWVSDCWRSGFSNEPAKNALDCNFRVLRGGSWASQAPALRSAERGWEKPNRQKNSIGFRVARSLP